MPHSSNVRWKYSMGDFPLGLKNQFVCVPHELEVLDFPKLHEDLDLKLYLCNDAENA
jgi:hypothetical protein